MTITRRRFNMENHLNLFGDTVPPPNELTVNQFYTLALQGGFKFELVDSKIIVTPKHAIDDEMRELIIKHKAHLINLISKNHQWAAHSNTIHLLSPQAQLRRERVLAMLEADPSIHRTMIDCHISDPLNVILTIAIRYIGTVEMMLPKASYDGMALLIKLNELQQTH